MTCKFGGGRIECDTTHPAPASPRVEPEMTRLNSTLNAKKLCAEWLATCVKLGWPKSALDKLELLWWEYHDGYGRIRHDN